MDLSELTPWEAGCYEILAAGMVLVAIAYVIWFFYDYISHGPEEPPGPYGYQ